MLDGGHVVVGVGAALHPGGRGISIPVESQRVSALSCPARGRVCGGIGGSHNHRLHKPGPFAHTSSPLGRRGSTSGEMKATMWIGMGDGRLLSPPAVYNTHAMTPPFHQHIRAAVGVVDAH